ncbi:MAG: hybrid sensor histidine kinase/response regulator [Anaerolineales bacterium]|nr:hybrid sensor histidine kinase/response regulator [Anaerolineales bacterium]
MEQEEDTRIKPIILIVDDEPSIRMGLSATISRHGYRVITAENGSDAILKAKDNHPDLIVSDIMMPVLNGFDMKKQMGEEPDLASIPFIFLTARTSLDDRLSGLREGADDYVTKPFTPEELIARIEAVLRRVERERERGREIARQDANEEMEKLRSELMKNFRHELRTPLSNVMMSLEMAVNNKFENPDELGEFIRIAHSSGDRLESLVADIILLTDIDQNELNRVRQSIDPELHILQPIKRRLARYESKSLNFIHAISLAEQIKAPRREFMQALVHLADNAFKFSPDGGTVFLKVHSGLNDGTVITIEDTGEGIPAELREKAFERFFQLSQGDAREQQGLGVGLTIARAVFQSLGGEVRILDSIKGCSVQASLPGLRPDDIYYG